MRPSKAYAHHIARALSATQWSAPSLCLAIQEATPHPLAQEWIVQLVDEVLAGASSYAPPIYWLVKFLRRSPNFWLIWEQIQGNIKVKRLTSAKPTFQPIPVFETLDIPPLANLTELADWLGLSERELEWFGGNMSHFPPGDIPALRHYHYITRQKRSGRLRMIEAPKTRLKVMQRKILHNILDHVPGHEANHGFTKECSPLTGAQLHCNQTIVIKLDLADFFPSVRARRVHGIYRCLGYPSLVADTLTHLTTARVPLSVLDSILLPSSKALPTTPRRSLWQIILGTFWQASSQSERLDYQQFDLFYYPHLPQGAPTSPALANLAAYKLDCRLAGLAQKFGANYTRYADDLTFSGDREFAKEHKHFLKLVRAIITDEGFTPREEKTKIMGAGASQKVTGIIVNSHLNLPRKDFDALKAILFNCIRHGPASQNRDKHNDFRAHLTGRVNWASQLNPRKGAKLKMLLWKVDWKK